MTSDRLEYNSHAVLKLLDSVRTRLYLKSPDPMKTQLTPPKPHTLRRISHREPFPR